MPGEIRDPSPVCPFCGRHFTVLGCTAERCAGPPDEARHDSDCPGRYGDACYGCTRADLAVLVGVVRTIQMTYELNHGAFRRTAELDSAREAMAHLLEKYGSKA